MNFLPIPYEAKRITVKARFFPYSAKLLFGYSRFLVCNQGAGFGFCVFAVQKPILALQVLGLTALPGLPCQRPARVTPGALACRSRELGRREVCFGWKRLHDVCCQIPRYVAKHLPFCIRAVGIFECIFFVCVCVYFCDALTLR